MSEGLGGLFQGISSLVSSIANPISSVFTMKRQMKHDKQMASINNQYGIDAFNRYNEYNTPQAQMNRMKEAGLNPNLAYGSLQNTSTQQNPGQGSSSQLQAPKFQPIDLSAILDWKQTDANIDLTRAQIEATESQNKLNAITALLQSSQTELNKTNDKYLKESLQVRINKLFAELDNTLQDTKYKQQSTLTSYAQQKNFESTNRYTIDKNIREWQMNKATLGEVYQRIEESKSRVKVNDANLGLISSSANLNREKLINEKILQKLNVVDLELGKRGLTRNSDGVTTIIKSMYQSLSNDSKNADDVIEDTLQKIRGLKKSSNRSNNSNQPYNFQVTGH